MPERSSPPAPRVAGRRNATTVDVITVTPRARHLAVLLARAGDARAKERWELPWEPQRSDETLEEQATRIARTALGLAPASVEQVAAFGDKRRHPSLSELSVAYLALTPAGAPALAGVEAAWFPVDEAPVLAPRQRAMLDLAMQILRMRLDQAPIAFSLLPPTFTLSQLQELYELLLGRRLHKASFRRALHAAWLVEPLDEWRSEGRGRPAQLFRFAPRRRRGARRGVRFDLLRD